MKKIDTILLVDDDKVNNYLTENLLKELNIAHQIKVVTNGLSALNYLKEECLTRKKRACPALVIFDYQMPVMDGMEFIKALHAMDFIHEQQVVFLLLGIYTTPADIEAFQQLGVQEFTTKPLSKKVVMDAYYKYWAGDTA